MFSSVQGSGVVTQQIQRIERSSFIELVNLARSPQSKFRVVYEKFFQLKQECPNRFDYDFIIKDGKGALFSKVVEIKAQQAHLFVEEIKECRFVHKSTDGFTRKITIDIPECPSFEERLYIDKEANGEIKVIFVQDHEKDLFACLNRVYQDEGQWHWSGSYLYGEINHPLDIEAQNKAHMFESTFAKMLDFMNDTSEFNSIYDSLQNW
jgi:hypothetical protein